MIPDNAEDLNALAGEYALGTLEDEPRFEVERALRINPALREAVAFWEQKLHPLAELAPPADPPPGLWSRIEARLPERPAAPRRRAAPWREAAFAAAAIAAGLAAWIVLRPAPKPDLVALLHAPDSATPVWMATVAGGQVSLASVAEAAPPAGRVFQLWLIAPGARAPRSLGVLPAATHTTAALAAGATLAISVEPPGGSPTGLPTGPVVYVGALAHT